MDSEFCLFHYSSFAQQPLVIVVFESDVPCAQFIDNRVLSHWLSERYHQQTSITTKTLKLGSSIQVSPCCFFFHGVYKLV
jgi:hypothetical protein